MSENHLDDLLDELVTVEPRPAWNDVLARARRSHRRFVALTAVVGLLVLVPTAWAIDGAFFGSPPPPHVTSAAAKLDKIYAQLRADIAKHLGEPKPETRADLSKLRGLLQVQTPDGLLDVWGAPGTDGGLCAFWAYDADSGGKSGSLDISSNGCSDPGGLDNNLSLGTSDLAHPDIYLTWGYTEHANAATVHLTFKNQDGVLFSKTVPVVDGFFLATFPRDPSTRDSVYDTTGLQQVIIYDASGNELRSLWVPTGLTGPTGSTGPTG